MDYVRLLGAALQKSREQQSEVGADPGAVPDLSDPPEVLIRRVAKMLDHLSTELQYGSLIQLYLPTTRADTGDVSLVTHKDFSRVNTVHEEKFWRYHEQSCAFFFNASPLSEDGLMGMPGRVFLGRRPEWTPSVCCYQPFEYPRLACAIESRVHTLLAIPLFLGDRDGDAKNDPPSSSDPSETQMPIGIMEFMMDHQTMLIGSVFESAAAMLEKHGFRTVGFDELAPPPRMRATLGDTLDAIDAKRAESVLREMTDSFRLPLAQCWVACPTGSSGRGAAAAAAASPRLVASGAPYSVGETAALPFRHMCEQVGLGADVQGPAARAFASGEMVWVDDVTKGSQLEWPLHHPAMLVGFRGACATSVWLDAAASAPPRCTRRSRCSSPRTSRGRRRRGRWWRRYARSSSVASRWERWTRAGTRGTGGTPRALLPGGDPRWASPSTSCGCTSTSTSRTPRGTSASGARRSSAYAAGSASTGGPGAASRATNRGSR